MSRTRRIYNRYPHYFVVHFWQSPYKGRLLKNHDDYWVTYRQICMGRCHSCRLFWQKDWIHDQAIKRRNAMEPLTMWGI